MNWLAWTSARGALPGGRGPIQGEAGAEETGVAAGEEQGDAHPFWGDGVAVGMGLALDEAMQP